MSAYSDLIAADGAVWYAKLGEASGTAAVDVISGNNGVYQNTPDLGQTGIVGDPGTAVKFKAASTEYVSVATIPSIADTFSFECWLKRTTASSGYHALFCGPAGNTQIYINPSNQIVFEKRGTGAGLITNETLSDTTAWHHIVIGKTGSTTRTIYLDGAVCTYTVNTNQTLSATTTANVAADNTAGSPTNGTMAHVALYTAELSSTVVAAHYAAGTSVSDPKLATPTTLALVTVAFAPTVTASDHKTVTPPTLALITAAFAPTVAATAHVAIRPDADVAGGGWTPAPLWSRVGESSADGAVITATAS